MPDLQWKDFAAREELDRQLADDVASQLREAISRRGGASLVLSGGSTPKGFLRMFAGCELDWSKLTVTLADDRWVPPEHADSNERLVRENLLVGPAADAVFIALVNEDSHPSGAEEAIEDRLAHLGTADVMILGMGGDGHFASLFPASTTLREGLDLDNPNSVIAVDPPVAPHPRMSMTLRRIFDSRSLILHIVGQYKRDIVHAALRTGDPEELPIVAVLRSEAPAPIIYWAP